MNGFGGMNFTIEEIEFDSERPYTVKLKGFLRKMRMLSYLKGV